ncbi:MAG: hypothetical protein JW748_03505 [Anaerolineales bacterium]|nr:hypothetical protein [Anaerolineales bacterium]
MRRVADPDGLIQRYDLRGLGVRSGTIHPFTATGNGVVGIGMDGTIDAKYSGGYFDTSNNYWLASGLFQIYDPMERLRYELRDYPPTFNPYATIPIWDTNSQGLFFHTEDAIYYWIFREQSPRRIGAYAFKEGNPSIYFIPIILVKSLQHLRVLLARFAKPAKGTSIWSRTEYKQLFQPGTSRYDITIPAYSSWRWSFSLGTTDPDLFEKILLPEDVEFRINGEWIDTNMFRMTDQTVEGRFSRACAAMLSGWRAGD